MLGDMITLAGCDAHEMAKVRALCCVLQQRPCTHGLATGSVRVECYM